MKCAKCDDKAVYKGQGQYFCKNHFLGYFENKVYKTINKYSLIHQDDVVCVATSGGKDSINTLYLINRYCIEYKIRFFALAIDEGIHDYRDKTLEDLRNFCKSNSIILHIASFKEYFKDTLDNMMIKTDKRPCTICGIFRRTLLNRKARELGATKLATGHNMDDEAQSFLMNILLGNMSHNASLGPITGLAGNEKFIQRIKPLYFMTEKESRLYALLKGFDIGFTECPNIGQSFRMIIRDELNSIEHSLPGAKNGIINSFNEILPTLKEYYGKQKSKRIFNYCIKCGDACSQEVCNACRLEEELNVSD
jgi:uncharacterized protein (TIGR00269 family)